MSCGCASRAAAGVRGTGTRLAMGRAVSPRAVLSGSSVSFAAKSCVAGGQQPQQQRFLSTSPSVQKKQIRKFEKKDRSVVKASDHMIREAGPPIKWTTESDFRREPLPPPASEVYSPETLSPAQLHTVFRWPDSLASTFSTLRSYAARGQPTNSDFSSFWVMRPHYYELAQRLNQTLTQDAHQKPDHSAYLLTGPHGSGKSHTLSFAIGHAKTQGAIVGYLPKATTLSMSRSEYAYSPQLQAWVQPKRADAIMLDLLAMNRAALPDVEVVSYPGLEHWVPEGKNSNVADLIREAVKETTSPTRKQEALELAFRSIIAQDKVPFVFALDEVEACFTPTEYRDPSYHTLQSFQLALPRFFLQILLDNARSAPLDAELRIKRGAALGALTNSQSGFRLANRMLNKVHDTVAGTIWEIYPKQLEEQHIQHAKACAFTTFNTERPLSVSEALALKTCSQTKCAGGMTPDDLRARLVECQGNPKRFINTLHNSMYHLGMTV